MREFDPSIIQNKSRFAASIASVPTMSWLHPSAYGVGNSLGVLVGASDAGETEGSFEGCGTVGLKVGFLVGVVEGQSEGNMNGVRLGIFEGGGEGMEVKGDDVGTRGIGAREGESVGSGGKQST